MAKLNIRNRNKDKVDKDGKPKAPNWEYRFEAAKIDTGLFVLWSYCIVLSLDRLCIYITAHH